MQNPRATRQEGAEDEAGLPAVQQDCPTAFGNSDIFGGRPRTLTASADGRECHRQALAPSHLDSSPADPILRHYLQREWYGARDP